MKTNKSMYLFAAALVAGTMGMTSCSNDEMDENLAKGKTTNIAIGMSVALPVQTKNATTPDEVNFGTTVADIQNVTIVPMVGTLVQKPIFLGKFDADQNTTHFKKASILETVDGFRVYGNLPNVISEEDVFTMPSLAKEASTDNKDVSVTDVYLPHSLYYYTESTSSNENKFEVGKGSVDGDWTSTSFAPTTGAVGDNNRIKIKKVTYAMGVFSAAVLDEVTGTPLTEDIFSDDGITPNASWEDLKAENGIKITGMIIEGQSKDFKEDFTPSDEEVKVFAAANSTALSTTDIEFEATTNKVKNANIYSVVAPENEQRIAVNFQFHNETEKHLHLNNGSVVAPNGYFYLSATLNKENSKNIFAAATSTLINARVKDWGKGTITPVETVDVEIGIEIETQWKEGIAFDEEI